MERKERIMKIKGYLGIFIFLTIIIIGKLAYKFELSYEIRYYSLFIFMFFLWLSLWLSTDLIKSWFHHKDRR